MKKLNLLIGVLFLVALMQSCSQESAVDYNNRIIMQQQEIVYKIDSLKKAIDQYNILPQSEAIDLMNAAYDSVIFQIDSSLSYMSTVEDFKGDLSLKDAAINLFTSYKEIMEEDYKQIIELYKIPDAMFSVSDQQRLDSLLEGSNQKLEDVLNTFVEIHTKFADNNNLVIE